MTRGTTNFQWTTYTAIVGSVLAREREMRRLGQAEVATRLPVSQSTWSRIERGHAPITVEQLQEFADLLGIPSDSLLREANRVRDVLKQQGVAVITTRNEEAPGQGLMLLGAAALGSLVTHLISKRDDDD